MRYFGNPLKAILSFVAAAPLTWSFLSATIWESGEAFLMSDGVLAVDSPE